MTRTRGAPVRRSRHAPSRAAYNRLQPSSEPEVNLSNGRLRVWLAPGRAGRVRVATPQPYWSEEGPPSSVRAPRDSATRGSS
jgi:hypothetical protein